MFRFELQRASQVNKMVRPLARPLTIRGPLATARRLLGAPRNLRSPFAVPYRAGLPPAVRTRPTELRGDPAPGAFSLLGSVAAKAQWQEDNCATVYVLAHSGASVRMILAPSGLSPLGASSLPAID